MERRDVWATLGEELALLRGGALAAPQERQAYTKAALNAFQTALCLSGGGIRSAAFALGALQALARHGLLAGFDYLSTVSGGGFVGGWLSVLLKENGSAEQVQRLMAADPPPPLRAMRDYTNYLTPRPGGLSLDTWAAIGLYLRNVALNWIVFIPGFAVAIVIAILYRTLLWQIGLNAGWSQVLIAIGALALLLATVRGCLALPSHRPLGTGHVPWMLRLLPQRLRMRLLVWFKASAAPAGEVAYASPEAIEWFIVCPALLWAVLGPMTLAGWYTTGLGLGLALPLVQSGVLLAGYVLAMLWNREFGLYAQNFDAWFLATLVSGLLLWAGVWLGAAVPMGDQPEALAVAGPLWFVLTQLVQTTVHVGFRRGSRRASLDREWLIRVSAMKLRPIALWTLFAFCALSLSRVGFESRSDWPFWAVALGTALSGPGGAWLGRQAVARVQAALQAPSKTDRFLGWLLPLLALLFAIGLAVLFGGVMAKLLGFLQTHGATILSGSAPVGPAHAEEIWFMRWHDWYVWLPLPLQIATTVILLVLLVSSSWRINVNRFSLHDVYRNRLSRAFLGSARSSRHPDPFTGFDPADNERLSEMVGQAPRKLFHVINTTLNLTLTPSPAWAERKAGPFTMTPLACGSAILRMPGQHPEEEPCGVYVNPGNYAGRDHETGRPGEARGITLATAMTLSGAAVSPNWGYHSSPATAFLMTLFNVRLGAWLPNPAMARTDAELQRSSPQFSLMPMLNELLGRTSDRTAEIYLSDGGHFENLGLYEMLRRRCRRILVIDAGQDADAQMTDLGNAARKAAIDLGVKITMFPMPIRSRLATEALSDEARAQVLGFATGLIRYPERRVGQLIYLKPSWLGRMPEEVRAYGELHPEFPHESTTEQWFTESQFESYRGLGEFQMSQLLAGVPPMNLPALFSHAARRAWPRPRRV